MLTLPSRVRVTGGAKMMGGVVMGTNSEYLEESCWEDGECSNECEQCNNITDRCCVSCDGRVGCQYLCRTAKLQQEHERKSDDELIKLFGYWSEQDSRFLYAEDRVRALSGKLAAAEARCAVLLKSYCGECEFDPEICRGTEPEIECAARVMDGTPEAALLAELKELHKAVTWMKTTAEYFRYKAPEQIDGLRLIAAMAATSKAALKEVPPCSE